MYAQNKRKKLYRASAAGRNVWCGAKWPTGPSRRPTSWPNHRHEQRGLLVFNLTSNFSTTSRASRRGFRRKRQPHVMPIGDRVRYVRLATKTPELRFIKVATLFIAACDRYAWLFFFSLFIKRYKYKNIVSLKKYINTIPLKNDILFSPSLDLDVVETCLSWKTRYIRICKTQFY